MRLAVVACVGAAVPWATLLVNVTGAGALGFVVGRQRARPEPSPVMFPLATGILGAYTTFSALAVEVLALGDGAPVTALAYGLGSVAVGLAAAAVGLTAGERRRAGAVATR